LIGAQQGMGQVFSMVMPMQPLDLIIVGGLWIAILAVTRDVLLVWAARIVTRWVPVEK
jgi:ABC-type proline/glycine betaine transport system permease subunit